MRRSEKILLAILVFGLLAWQVQRLVQRLMIDPIQRSRAELARLDDQVAEQKLQTARLQNLESELTDWQRQSLPPDPLTAQRLYQQWLTDLAQDSGFTSLKVFPDRVTQKSDACLGVLVSIDAEAQLDQLCLFLRRFYRTDLAQQITVLNIDSTRDRGNPPLRVTIMAEGLSLRKAKQRQRLFPVGTLATSVNDQQTNIEVEGVEALPPGATYFVRIGGEYMAGERSSETKWKLQRGVDRSSPRPHSQGELVEFIPLVERGPGEPAFDDESLLARHPFPKPTPQVAERPPPPKQLQPKIDAAEFTYLVAAFAQDDQRQAWLYDRLNNENIVIGSGKPFSVSGIEGVVQEIGNNYVVLNHREARWRLRLGKNLRSMEQIPDAK